MMQCLMTALRDVTDSAIVPSPALGTVVVLCGSDYP
jgi:hypothetical protein